MRPGERWALVASASARLSSDVQWRRRRIRGETWGIVSNGVSGDQLRVDDTVLSVLEVLDSAASVDAAWQRVAPRFADDQEPSDETARQDELASALLSLAQCGIVRFDLPGDTERVLRRSVARTRQLRRSRWANPLALRLPLHDPDAWLERLAPLCNGLFTRRFLVFLGTLLCGATVMLLERTSEFEQQWQRLLSNPTEWWVYGLLYPVFKLLHEIAHGVAVKRWGGQVHEMGMSLLVLMPVPYIDATDAWTFDARRARVIVGAAGLLIELLLAGVAALVWCLAEAGALRDLCFAVMLLIVVPTLLFNANPLMKFDGYQILQDALDMPNLAPRSSAYLRYLVKRYLFGMRLAESPVSAVGERRWLMSYAVSAALFRAVLTLGIALWLAREVPLVGVPLALYALGQWLVLPLMRFVRFLATSEELGRARTRASGVSLAFLCLLAGATFVPLPAHTRTLGQVWVAGQAELRAAETGYVSELFFSAGDVIQAGELVARLHDPELHRRVGIARAELAQLHAQRRSALQVDALEARLLAGDIERQAQRLRKLEQQQAALAVRARSSGRFMPPMGQALPGRLLQRGDVIGHVVDPAALRVRAAVEEAQLDRFSEGVLRTRVRLLERPDEVLDAQLVTQTPAAQRHLPSDALAKGRAGGIAVASSSAEALETVQPVFHVEFALPADSGASGIGGRAYVAIEHPAESAARRIWRSLRQVFLDQLAM